MSHALNYDFFGFLVICVHKVLFRRERHIDRQTDRQRKEERDREMMKRRTRKYKGRKKEENYFTY